MRRYEWLLTASLVSSGLICLVTATGLGAGSPGGLPGRLVHWLMENMTYLMLGFGLLWIWAVWGLVASIWRDRGQGECRRCGRPAEPDWRHCPYCGAEFRTPP